MNNYGRIMIYITGDTHGLIDFKKLEEFNKTVACEQDNHYMIILGDVGIAGNEEYIKKYSELNFTMLFLDGNHENFTALNKYPTETFNGGIVHRVAPNIIHLMRGQIYSMWNGERTIRFATLGGGDSRDIKIRLKNEKVTGIKTWWKEERITDEDILELERNAQLIGNKMDYFLSHSPSATLKIAIDRPPTESDYMVRKPMINANIEAEQYICGHEHIDYENYILGKYYRIIYNKIHCLS